MLWTRKSFKQKLALQSLTKREAFPLSDGRKWMCYLNSGFGQVDLQSDFFSHENVGVSRFGKQRFQYVQLSTCKCSPFSPLFTSSAVTPYQITRWKYKILTIRNTFELNMIFQISLIIIVIYQKREEIKKQVIFTWSVHTWREPNGRMEWVHGGWRHSQTGQTGHATAAHLSVMMV